MASDFEKPDKIHTLFRSEIEEKMWPLSVDKLFFAGKAATGKLSLMGIKTIGDLAHSNPKFAFSLKKTGNLLYNYANGIDEFTRGRKKPNPKMGTSMNNFLDVKEKETANFSLSLAETVAPDYGKTK
jgi:DNA polymerase-4